MVHHSIHHNHFENIPLMTTLNFLLLRNSLIQLIKPSFNLYDLDLLKTLLCGTVHEYTQSI